MTFRLHRTEVANPIRRGDLPVLGVPSDSARSYASDQDKRLLTEVEWQRASFVYKIPDDLKVVTRPELFLATHQRFNAEMIEVMRQRAALAAMEPQSRRGNRPTEDAAYNILHSPLPPDLIGDFRKLQDEAGDLAPSGGILGEVHPVDTYPADVSIFGVRDVLSNPAEILLNKGKQDCVSPTKIFNATADPYASFIGVYENGEMAKHYFIDILPTAGIYFIDRVVLDSGQEPPSFGIFHESLGVDERGLPFSYSYTAVTTVPPEFRCAR